jgi:hypothetical protein
VPAPYFDPEDAECASLLPPDLRRDGDTLTDLARSAEADVVGHYTLPFTLDSALPAPLLPDVVTLTDGRRVGLAGYKEDAALASLPFRNAMRREIADVIVWRRAQWDRKPGVKSETKGDPVQSVTYNDRVAELVVPPGFGRWLRPFDVRPVAWGV